MKDLTSSTISLLIIISLLLTGACSAPTAQLSNAPAPFKELCASCHGEDLKGGIAQSLLDGSWQFGARENDIFRVIKFGLPHHGMPSWQAALSDEKIKELVDFLMSEEERLGVNESIIPSSLETQDHQLAIEVFAEGLETPWSLDFISADEALITERSGRLRMVKDGKLLADSITGIPTVTAYGQGGLFDVTLDPNYEDNGWVYLAYSHGLQADKPKERAPTMTRVVRGRIDNLSWTDEQLLFEAKPETYRTSGAHFGGRIVFDPEGYLFFSIGDRGAPKHAQDLSLPNGKIHRIYPDGRIPEDNPFVRQQDALPSIYSYGHRNPQGLAVHPETGRVWDTEHGPLGGDEANLIMPGLNYGWPVITYGRNYNGTPVTDIVRKEGMEQPNWYWKPSIAVCGLHFYDGELFPKWKNQLLVGALKFEEVQLLNIDASRVIYQQTLIKNFGRVRDVTTGPDGAIYVILNRPGTIIRLTPSNSEEPI